MRISKVFTRQRRIQRSPAIVCRWCLFLREAIRCVMKTVRCMTASWLLILQRVPRFYTCATTQNLWALRNCWAEHEYRHLAWRVRLNGLYRMARHMPSFVTRILLSLEEHGVMFDGLLTHRARVLGVKNVLPQAAQLEGLVPEVHARELEQGLRLGFAAPAYSESADKNPSRSKTECAARFARGSSGGHLRLIATSIGDRRRDKPEAPAKSWWLNRRPWGRRPASSDRRLQAVGGAVTAGRPRNAAQTVINFGRTRLTAPSTMASSRSFGVRSRPSRCQRS